MSDVQDDLHQEHTDPGGEPPEDDRNDEVEGSPAPDPTDGADAEDVPEAD